MSSEAIQSIQEKVERLLRESATLTLEGIVEQSEEQGEVHFLSSDGALSVKVAIADIQSIDESNDWLRFRGKPHRVVRVSFNPQTRILLSDIITANTEKGEHPCSPDQEGAFQCIHGTQHRCIRQGPRHIWWDWRSPCLDSTASSQSRAEKQGCNCGCSSASKTPITRSEGCPDWAPYDCTCNSPGHRCLNMRFCKTKPCYNYDCCGNPY